LTNTYSTFSISLEQNTMERSPLLHYNFCNVKNCASVKVLNLREILLFMGQMYLTNLVSSWMPIHFCMLGPFLKLWFNFILRDSENMAVTTWAKSSSEFGTVRTEFFQGWNHSQTAIRSWKILISTDL
jgi:hypothetical protein